jgi:hypothetical protein
MVAWRSGVGWDEVHQPKLVFSQGSAIDLLSIAIIEDIEDMVRGHRKALFDETSISSPTAEMLEKVMESGENSSLSRSIDC